MLSIRGMSRVVEKLSSAITPLFLHPYALPRQRNILYKFFQTAIGNFMDIDVSRKFLSDSGEGKKTYESSFFLFNGKLFAKLQSVRACIEKNKRVLVFSPSRVRLVLWGVFLKSS